MSAGQSSAAVQPPVNDAIKQLQAIKETNLELQQAHAKINALLMERSQSQRRDQEKIKALRQSSSRRRR
jgi:hypothetical protein